MLTPDQFDYLTYNHCSTDEIRKLQMLLTPCALIRTVSCWILTGRLSSPDTHIDWVGPGTVCLVRTIAW